MEDARTNGDLENLHRPCYLAIDRNGKVRGRYRFARLAILEASEHGWELQMSGCDS